MRLSAIYESLGKPIDYEISGIDSLLAFMLRYPKCFGVVGVDGTVWVSHSYVNPDEGMFDGPHEALMASAGLAQQMNAARFLIHNGDVSVGPLDGEKSAHAVLAVLEKVSIANKFPVYWDAYEGLGGVANTRVDVLKAIRQIRQALQSRSSTQG